MKELRLLRVAVYCENIYFGQLYELQLSETELLIRKKTMLFPSAIYTYPLLRAIFQAWKSGVGEKSQMACQVTKRSSAIREIIIKLIWKHIAITISFFSDVESSCAIPISYLLKVETTEDCIESIHHKYYSVKQSKFVCWHSDVWCSLKCQKYLNTSTYFV